MYLTKYYVIFSIKLKRFKKVVNVKHDIYKQDIFKQANLNSTFLNNRLQQGSPK